MCRLTFRVLAGAMTCAPLWFGLGCSEADEPPLRPGQGGAAPGGSSSGGSGKAPVSTAGSGGSASSGGSAGGGVSSSGGAAPGGIAGDGGATAGGGAAGSGAQPPGGSGGSGGAGGPPWVDLFNGTDLTGFKVYRQTTERQPGTLLTMQQGESIFKPGGGLIHVHADDPNGSAQVHYTLVTNESYGKYNLSWEYKWGSKKFAPYTNVQQYPRDAGVLFHLHGDISQLWPRSIEFQNKDGSTGDIFALYAGCTSLAKPGMNDVFAEAADGGVPVLVNGSNGFVQHERSMNHEVPNDYMNANPEAGWNTSLMEVDGQAAVFHVNGHIVNRVLSIMDSAGEPVSSGPIAWQAEQAEVYYRNLRIQVLP